jgi:peptidase M28-like protein
MVEESAIRFAGLPTSYYSPEMAASLPPGRRRRRPRRGSLERPVSSQLYRGAFLLCSLPLLLAAFSVTKPGPLPKPLLPPAFDAQATLGLARALSTTYPDRSPGSSGALAAAEWFREQLAPYGLTTTTDSWQQTLPGGQQAHLENLAAVAQGQSQDAIVVMAHRDDTGAGPGANDNATGTAALIELARAYARPQTEAQAAVQSAHKLVFLSTDGGAYGGLGAARFVERTRLSVVAVINLDSLAGPGPPRLEFTGDQPRSPATTLVATATARILEQAGKPPRHPGFFGQLVDLGFPFSLYEQAPFIGRGISAITLTTGGNRPPAAFGDTAGRLAAAKLATMGRAAQELLGSLNQGLEVAQGTRSFVLVGDRTIRGWAIELVLITLLVPFLVAVVDLFALGRRHGMHLGPAIRALRSRLAFWAFAGIVFTCFRLLGAFGSGPARPPNPGTAFAGDWPAVALIGFGTVVGLGWLVARHRLVPRRPVTAEERLAGQTVALLGLTIVGLLIVGTNPFALLFALPALHVWLWLPQIQRSRLPARLGLFALGLVGPAIVILSLAWRFGLGLDAPWYLVLLVVVGYVKTTPVVIVLAGAAAASQLATVATGRYAPYPNARERGPRGPLRELIRVAVLGMRARREEREARIRAAGS